MKFKFLDLHFPHKKNGESWADFLFVNMKILNALSFTWSVGFSIFFVAISQWIKTKSRGFFLSTAFHKIEENPSGKSS